MDMVTDSKKSKSDDAVPMEEDADDDLLGLNDFFNSLKSL